MTVAREKGIAVVKCGGNKIIDLPVSENVQKRISVTGNKIQAKVISTF